MRKHPAGLHSAGENHFVIAPVPGKELTYAQACYKSLYGEVKSRWEKKENGVHYTVTIPANCTAEIRLSGQPSIHVTAGTYDL